MFNNIVQQDLISLNNIEILRYAYKSKYSHINNNYDKF